MSITIECPNPDCRQKYAVKQESLGGQVTCKKCGKGFTVEMKADETGVHNPPASHAPPPSTGGSERAVTDRKESKPLPKAVPLPETPPAKKIGPYTVRRRLGEGGMGEVWLAHDPSLDRDVAIKTLPPRFADNEDRLKRFLREARLAAKLHHTNTVTVYQVGQEGSLVYIAMEYVDGQSLDNAVSEGRPMPWQEATRAIRDAAAGLAAAHELGLVHRDIKPANLMRTKTGVTKVADFGLARSQFAESRMTQEGSVLGTPAYMSPEQWQGGQVDGRSDLYSLACAYYCLLTGQDPFGDTAPGALGYMHCHKPVPDPRQLSPDLPDTVCRILARGLEKKPEERYQSAGELLAELEALLATPDGSPASRVSWEQLQTSPALAGGTASRDGVRTALVRAKTAVLRGVSAMAAAAKHGGVWRKWPGHPVLRVVAGLGAAALLLLLGIVLLIPTGHGTVKIELSDPKARVEVKVDGDVIDIAGLKEPLRLKAGEHGLLVTSGDYQSVSKSFTVRRGQEEILRVTLEPKPVEKPVPVMPPVLAPATSPEKEIAVDLGNGVKLEMVLIPAGEFMMGSGESAEAMVEYFNANYSAYSADIKAEDYKHEHPQHRVRITKAFYLGARHVTRGQFAQFVADEGYKTDAEKDGKGGVAIDDKGQWTQKPEYTWRTPGFAQTDDHPVVNVSWNDAVAFCQWLGRKDGKNYRLPAEAEWEYACRAGTTTRYWCGDDPEGLAQIANVADATAKAKFPGWSTIRASDGYVFTSPVGSFRPNAFGLYDMHGNAWQWCRDRYGADYYTASPPDDPKGPDSGPDRVVRGGSWNRWSLNARSADRSRFTPDFRSSIAGFRVARTP